MTAPCNCHTCVEMCLRPCWPTPQEANRIMDLGYGPCLMLDYWVNIDKPDTYIVCPANLRSQGTYAPSWPGNNPADPCALLDKGLCMLHKHGAKPLEARLASCNPHQNDSQNIHERIAKLWDTPLGRKTVERFKKEFLR